jgi:hypothetical protein
VSCLNQVRQQDQRTQAHAILSAFSAYLIDRLEAPRRTLTASEMIDLLQGRCADGSIVAELGMLLDECEQIAFAGHAGAGQGDLLSRAHACLNRLDRSDLP